MKREPVVNSLHTAIVNFGGPEVPSSESLRDLVYSTVLAGNGGETDDEHVLHVLDGLISAYLAACAAEDNEDDEDGDAPVLEYLAPDEAERVYMRAYVQAYAQGMQRNPEDVEGLGFPDHLPQRSYPRWLVIDFGRLLGYDDARRSGGAGWRVASL